MSEDSKCMFLVTESWKGKTINLYMNYTEEHTYLYGWKWKGTRVKQNCVLNRLQCDSTKHICELNTTILYNTNNSPYWHRNTAI